MTETEALEAFYAALREDDAEALYERAPCGYLSTTPDGTIIKVNGTFLSWTGYDRAELIGRTTFSELLSPGGRIYHETHYAPMLRLQGKAREIALEVVRADGARLPVLVNSVLERDGDGTPFVVRTAVFDATERRMYEQELLRAKQRAEESEQRATLLARTLQQTLIPPAPPEVPGLEVAAAYRPSGAGDEVGGDFYDVFQLGQDDWVAVIGDVRGKGVEAAVVTALVRHTVRAAAVRCEHTSDVLHTLNQVLLADRTDRFCTVLVVRARLSGDGWAADVCAGGHGLPVLVHDGVATFVGRPGTLIGVVDRPSFEPVRIALGAGDALLLYTDGVPEARSSAGFFGDDRLLDCAQRDGASAHALVEGLLAEVMEFQSGHARDDIALVAIRVPGE